MTGIALCATLRRMPLRGRSNSLLLLLITTQGGEMVLKEGDEVPDITFESLEGEVNLKEASRGTAVFYFYPKDHTPGCTREAKSFKQAMPEFEKLGVKVYGISKDSLKAHKSFSEKHSLNFPLLSDSQGKAIEAFGVRNEKSKAGSAKRVTFIVNDGKITHVFNKVKPDNHASEVLEIVKKLLADSH